MKYLIFVIVSMLFLSNSSFYAQNYEKYNKSDLSIVPWNPIYSMYPGDDEFHYAKYENFKRYAEDKNENTWIRQSKGIIKCTNDTIISYNSSNGFECKWTEQILADSHNGIWISTRNGLYRYINNRFEFFNKKNQLPSNLVLNIHLDNYENIWINTSKGTVIYNYEKGWINSNKTIAASGEFLFGKKGEVFFRSETKNFIGVYNGLDFTIIYTDDKFRKILYDQNDNAWFLTKNTFYTYNSKMFVDYPIPECKFCWAIDYITLIDDNILLANAADNIYLQKDNGWSVYEIKPVRYLSSQEGATILFMHKDKNNDVWFGTHQYGLHKLKDNILGNCISKREISSAHKIMIDVFEDENRNLWFMSTKGFILYDINTKQITDFEGEIIKDVGLPDMNNTNLLTTKSFNTDLMYVDVLQSSSGKTWLALAWAQTIKKGITLVGSIAGAKLIGCVASIEGNSLKIETSLYDVDGCLTLFEDNNKNIWVDGVKTIYKFKQ